MYVSRADSLAWPLAMLHTSSNSSGVEDSGQGCFDVFDEASFARVSGDSIEFDFSFEKLGSGLPGSEYILGEYCGRVNESFVHTGAFGTRSIFG